MIRKDDLVKADLLSEIVLLASGVLVGALLITITVAAYLHAVTLR